MTLGGVEDQQAYQSSSTEFRSTRSEPVDKRGPVGLYVHQHKTLGHPLNSLLSQWYTLGLVEKSVIRLDPVNFPKYPACLYDKPKIRSHLEKSWPIAVIKVVRCPGSVVYIDQMISSTPFFIAQLRGFLTKNNYTFFTVSVDVSWIEPSPTCKYQQGRRIQSK